MMGGGADVVKTDIPDSALAHQEGVRAVGLAEFLAVGANRPTGPSLYRDWTGGGPRERRITPLDQLEVTADLLARNDPGPEGLLQLAISLPVFSAEELAGDHAGGAADLSRRTLRLAADTGALLTQDGHREGTMSAAAARVGLGGPHAVFAHSIDLTPADIDALKRSGAAVAHNAAALMSVIGRCPAPELAAEGVTVALGSDAPAPDRSFDMFRLMFQAHRYHARHFRDAGVLPPWQLLEWATIGGAKALGMADEIGSLEPGKRADIIIVDWRKPHLWPPACPVDRLARFANGADVDTVIVAGRVLMRNRKALSCDPDRILNDAAAAYERMIERAGIGAEFASYPASVH
jgi:5-methylthioadenosine/S-adenosylhomocysteine deaminase